MRVRTVPVVLLLAVNQRCLLTTVTVSLLLLSLAHVQALLLGGTGGVCCHITTETGASCRTRLLSQCSDPPG